MVDRGARLAQQLTPASAVPAGGDQSSTSSTRSPGRDCAPGRARSGRRRIRARSRRRSSPPAACGLAQRDEAEPEAGGDRRAEDEPARLDPGDRRGAVFAARSTRWSTVAAKPSPWAISVVISRN
jgi:hypothetical protein